jgi:signal transduction histidine kinase
MIETGAYGPVTDKKAAVLQQLRRSTRGLLQMIDDLLDLARHDAGKLQVRPVDVDLPSRFRPRSPPPLDARRA